VTRRANLIPEKAQAKRKVQIQVHGASGPPVYG